MVVDGEGREQISLVGRGEKTTGFHTRTLDTPTRGGDRVSGVLLARAPELPARDNAVRLCAVRFSANPTILNRLGRPFLSSVLRFYSTYR